MGRSIVVGGVAGAAWVTPTIFSANAAAAGTDPECCQLQPIDLLASPFGEGLDLYPTAGPLVTGLGTYVSVMFWPDDEQHTITTNSCTGGMTHGVITDCELGGISTGQMPLVGRIDAGSPSLELMMVFDPPVARLKFTITNIDENTDPEFAYSNALRLSFDFANQVSEPVLTLGTNLEITGNEIPIVVPKSGTGPADPSSADWNLAVDCGCDNLINGFSIVAWNWGDGGTSSTAGRVLGIADIQVCLPPDP